MSKQLTEKEMHRVTCQSFFSQVIPHLVNTNIDKYYPVGSFGLRALNMTAVQQDIAILEKYYRWSTRKSRSGVWPFSKYYQR